MAVNNGFNFKTIHRLIKNSNGALLIIETNKPTNVSHSRRKAMNQEDFPE